MGHMEAHGNAWKHMETHEYTKDRQQNNAKKKTHTKAHITTKKN